MHRPVKYFEQGLVYAANAAWFVFSRINKIRPNPGFVPAWSDKPLQKSWEKTRPTLGVPRKTDSLCPKCVPEIRAKILDGEMPVEVLKDEKIGEIKAEIIERDGKIWMVKDCPKHGRFEDVMSTDPEMFARLEAQFPGRDQRSHNDETLHDHGTSTVKYGRGTVLTIDLTNRCNMMCDPCFMDANQVGFVHELSWSDIKQVLDNAIQIKPRRQMSVQFSGGEPTTSPFFLDAIRYSRKVGYLSVQAATNGIAFAQDPQFARDAAEAGLRYAYLQFDGVGNAANAHRHVGNLFDVKLQAIENLHSSGVEIVPVTTLINGINNEQVGRIIEFARDNPRKIVFLAFQPVSFTGRDEEITDERRHAQRYTLADLAHDVKNQTGMSEPNRDWFPLSYISTFSDLADLVHGPDHQWGQYSCGCHPNCGIGMGTMIDKVTGEMVPITAFIRGDRLSSDTKAINDAARSKFWSIVGFSLSVIRNYRPFESPRYFSVFDMLKKFDKQFGGTGMDYGNSGADRTMEDIDKRRDDRWGSLIIAGMWFQDLFNYDFRRTEQCIIPYGTQEGEISFCAYNTGVGWRNIIEKMHMTSKLNEWYEEHGRHEIWAGNREVEMDRTEHSMLLRDEIVTTEEQHDLDDLGIAKYAHEEKRAKRDEKLAELRAKAENEKMAKLYRQEVLGEVAQQAETGTPGKPKKVSQIELG